jgi:hypothetical protein
VQEIATAREVFVSYGHDLLTWDDVHGAIMNVNHIAETRAAVQREES